MYQGKFTPFLNLIDSQVLTNDRLVLQVITTRKSALHASFNQSFNIQLKNYHDCFSERLSHR